MSMKPHRRPYSKPVVVSSAPESGAVLLACTPPKVDCPGFIGCCVNPSETAFCGDPGEICNP